MDWQVSHNSYTQVSSELGLPGILLLLAIYATAFRQVWRIHRAAKRRGREDVRQTSFVLLIALAVLCIHFCFDSMAYVFYLLLITGITAAFALAYGPLTLDEEEAAPEPEAVLPAKPASRLCGGTRTGLDGGVRPQGLAPNPKSPVLVFHFAQPVGPLQHFARLAAVGRPDDAVALHHVENARGAAVAQAQTPLQRGSRRLAHLAAPRARLPRTSDPARRRRARFGSASSSSSAAARSGSSGRIRARPAPSRNPPRR